MASLTQTASHPASKLREWLYLDLALLGALVPGYLFAKHIAAAGVSQILPLAFANTVSAALTADLLISSLAFWILAAREMDRLGTGKGKLPLFMLLNVCIGLSAALPAFMWWREHQLKRAAERL
ncbi:MAG: hypothetical protein CVV27_07020 [Candidatus Melainabacteria bacterium HGW-Melainabacteria-1]|nr:MAG: hypothetical protein CVV27_07020 [Candidatus Melainabacteria bacterium HGW-Melainabacteria-1]